MEGTIFRWLPFIGYRSSAVAHWLSVTTGDSISANPPSLPDGASCFPSLIHFLSWLPSWNGEPLVFLFLRICHQSICVPSTDNYEEESTIRPSTNADAIITCNIYFCVILRNVWSLSACLMRWLF